MNDLIQLTSLSFNEAANLIKTMQLTPAEEKKLNRKLATWVRKNARVRASKGENIDGTRYTQRKGERSKRRKQPRRKIYKDIAKAKHLKTTITPNGASIRYKKAWIGKAARRMQEGITETVNVNADKRYQFSNAGDSEKKPATKRQALELKAAGFKKRGKQGNYVNASTRWIMENMTIEQAGVVLRSMRDQGGNKTWDIETVARSFLGVSEPERKQYVKALFEEMKK